VEKLYEKLSYLYSSPNNVGLIKIRTKEMGRVCGMYVGERCIQDFGGGNLRERDHLQDPGIDERIILRWIFKKWDVGAWSGLIWLWIGTGGIHW
jgi:hypothetical protein